MNDKYINDLIEALSCTEIWSGVKCKCLNYHDGMNTYSLYDNAVTTCMGNDYGYEYIFSRPMEFLLRKGDLLVAISSSGNSSNILNAIETARLKGQLLLHLQGSNRIIEQSRWGM